MSNTEHKDTVPLKALFSTAVGLPANADVNDTLERVRRLYGLARGIVESRANGSLFPVYAEAKDILDVAVVQDELEGEA